MSAGGEAVSRSCPACGAVIPEGSLVCGACGAAIGGRESFAALLEELEGALAELKAVHRVGVFESLSRQAHVVLPLCVAFVSVIAIGSPYDSDFNTVVVPVFLVFAALSAFAIRVRWKRRGQRVDQRALRERIDRAAAAARRAYGAAPEVQRLLADHDAEMRLLVRTKRRDLFNAVAGYLFLVAVFGLVAAMIPWRDDWELARIREDAEAAEAAADLAPVRALAASISPHRTALGGALADIVGIEPGPVTLTHEPARNGVRISAANVPLVVTKAWDLPGQPGDYWMDVWIEVLDPNGYAFYRDASIALQDWEGLAAAIAKGPGARFLATFAGETRARWHPRRVQLVRELLSRNGQQRAFVVSSALRPKAPPTPPAPPPLAPDAGPDAATAP